MFKPEPFIPNLFYRLRQDGFNLSIKEYFAALDAIKGGWGTKNKEEFKKLLLLLWCKSLEQRDYLEMIFDTIVVESEDTKETREHITTDEERSPKTITEEDTNLTASFTSSTQPIYTEVTKPVTQELSTLPVKSPKPIVESSEDAEFQTHYPISRRFMVYSWRYLRRPVAGGIKDVLDIPLTVSQTAQYESSIERVDVGYFHNLPAEYIYRDRFLTDKIALETVLSQCDSETRVLIVSDGGAARGYRRRERVSATTEVLWEIEQHTNLIAWLNPVPRLRWNSTTAKITSHLVPMFPLNKLHFVLTESRLRRVDIEINTMYCNKNILYSINV